MLGLEPSEPKIMTPLDVGPFLTPTRNTRSMTAQFSLPRKANSKKNALINPTFPSTHQLRSSATTCTGLTTGRSSSAFLTPTRNTRPSMTAQFAGAPASQVRELFHEGGVIAPSKKGLKKMMDKTTDVVRDVSEQQLKQNRKEHVKAAREMSDYEGDHKFTDSSGKEHSISVGPVAVNGNGEKRAYGHIITGEQHCTVIISLITGKPLHIWHDQISCVHCQHKLTELLNQSNKKRAADITSQDLAHPGKKCHRNSKHGPASAEEWALESFAKFLLMDPETGDIRPNDEAILVNFVIGDGDTKGPTKFMNKQADIVPTFKGRAQYLPDIGHFIKGISNLSNQIFHRI